MFSFTATPSKAGPPKRDGSVAVSEAGKDKAFYRFGELHGIVPLFQLDFANCETEFLAPQEGY